MSSVTDIVFMCSHADTNAWEAVKPVELVGVDRFAGGPKGMERGVYLGTFSYYDGEVHQAIRRCAWTCNESVVLIVRQDDAARPTVLHSDTLLEWCPHGRVLSDPCPLCAWVGSLVDGPCPGPQQQGVRCVDGWIDGGQGCRGNGMRCHVCKGTGTVKVAPPG